MNIVNTLTLRHIKTHKKRTILTIVAIIVSVAMVTAVFTSAISFIKYFQNSTLEVDGNWHVQFTDDDYSLHKSLFATDVNIDEFAARAVCGTTTFGVNDRISPYSSGIFCAEKNWFGMRNVTVSQGRLPENSHELLLTTRAIKEFDLNVRVGDKITVPVSVVDEEKAESVTVNREYEIVGISDSFVSATDGYAVFSGLDSEALKESEGTIVIARYDKLDNSIYDKIEQTMKTIGFSGYKINTELFTFSLIRDGNGMIVSLGLFAGILLLIIAVVSVFMIYDSFAVSYQERAKYLGMLASVGATKKQKRMSIYFEGLILGLISVPLGIISGISGIAITFKCIEGAFLSTVNPDYQLGSLNVYVNWFVIIGTVIASAITIFISMYIPARKASKTSPIDAIRQANTVKVKKPKKLRVSRLTGKIFGYEGTLAVKNFKRNGRRSRNIVFSLALSVVVFLTVTNFSAMLNDILKTSLTLTPDIMISGDYKGQDAIVEAVSGNKKIERYFYNTTAYANIDRAYFEKIGEDEESGVLLVFLDNSSFDGYLRQLGERPENYHGETPTAIVLNSIFKVESGKKKVREEPLKNLKGQSLLLNLQYTSNEGEEENNKPLTKESEITVGIQTTKQWNEEKFTLNNSALPLIIMSEDYADSVMGETKDSAYTEVSIMCDDFETIREELINSIKEKDSEIGFFIETPGAGYDQMNNLFTIAKVFIYGFITLISIISVLNIINTISNSMNERRREFAMLRSVGMTPKSFKRMIYLEAGRYGAKALLFSIPVGILIHFAMYKALSGTMDFGFIIHPLSYVLAVIAVFVIIGTALLYSIDKIRDDNIIETLKTDI